MRLTVIEMDKATTPLRSAPVKQSAIRLPPAVITDKIAKNIDYTTNALTAHFTHGVAPRVLTMTYMTWLLHLVTSPGKQTQLVEKAWRKLTRFMIFGLQHTGGPGSCPSCIEPLAQDRRFRAAAWQQWPFNLTYQAFLLTQQWWDNAMTGVPGVSKEDENIVAFVTRQWLDVYSPSNSLLTNPEVMQATVSEGGANLARGWQNFMEDWQWTVGGGKPPGVERFQVGRDVAITPGKVIYRNRLVELIQYTPSTARVHPEPVLVVPAWIMKYYILDLSPHNSLVKYLVDQGHTVFMISWCNPTEADRDLGMDDYRRLGVMEALDAINAIVPAKPVHAVGYCLGGTLLTIAAAAMARDGDERLASVSLLAAQTDFTEAGELNLFINEGQVNFLESMMWARGVLNTDQMSGAFQLLRSNDLIWSRMVHDYLLGQRRPPNDLMAWNADQTRMPYKMHSQYLRSICLNNDLAQGRYRVDERPISVSDIRAPIFAVGTSKDHVAPWRSVFKIHLLSDASEVTFVLTNGGHNAGMVSEPGHPRRQYQITTNLDGDGYIDPDTWQTQTPLQNGSWWPAWQRWLAERSGSKVKPPTLGVPQAGLSPLSDAPGSYVFQE